MPLHFSHWDIHGKLLHNLQCKQPIALQHYLASTGNVFKQSRIKTKSFGLKTKFSIYIDKLDKQLSKHSKCKEILEG
jgi:hypothetical protein